MVSKNKELAVFKDRTDISLASKHPNLIVPEAKKALEAELNTISNRQDIQQVGDQLNGEGKMSIAGLRFVKNKNWTPNLGLGLLRKLVGHDNNPVKANIPYFRIFTPKDRESRINILEHSYDLFRNHIDQWVFDLEKIMDAYTGKGNSISNYFRKKCNHTEKELRKEFAELSELLPASLQHYCFHNQAELTDYFETEYFDEDMFMDRIQTAISKLDKESVKKAGTILESWKRSAFAEENLMYDFIKTNYLAEEIFRNEVIKYHKILTATQEQLDKICEDDFTPQSVLYKYKAGRFIIFSNGDKDPKELYISPEVKLLFDQTYGLKQTNYKALERK